MSQHIPIEDLSAHIDEALPPARRDLVEAHLAVCAECRAERASLAWAADFARALPAVEPPSDTSFFVPIASAVTDPRPPDRVRPRWRWFAVPALGAAMLLFAVGLGRWMTAAPAVGPSEPRADSAPGTLPSGTQDRLTIDALGTRLSATGEPLDIDTASRMAGGLVKQGDGAEAQTRPLATALTADRSQRVEGELGTAGVPATPPAVPPGAGTASAGADATALASIDRGGYAPPDAPIPGLPGARGRQATAAQATAAPSSGPVGGLQPPPPGTLTAWAATNTIDRARSAETGTAAARANPPPSATQPAYPATSPLAASPEPPTAPSPEAPAAPRSETPPAPPPGTPAPAPPASPSPPSRSFLVPLLALSIGFLALGILLLRQARARRRRRTWRLG